MPVYPPVPRELGVSERTTTATTTSTAVDGAAFASPWTLTFVVAHITNVEIVIHVPQIAHSSTEWAGVICWLDSATNLGVRYFWSWLANLPEGGKTGVWRTTLTAGSHTVEVRGKVGAAGTGTFAMTSTDKGILRVREVG